MNCVFCRIIAGVEPRPDHYVEWPDYSVAIFEPLNPFQPGHRLIVPIAHVPDATTSPLTSGEVFAAASVLAAKYGGPANILTSIGSEATQTVFHLHLHFIPRGTHTDTLARGWPWRQK